MKIRVGQGIDIHRFAKGRKLVLGGVNIPNEYGLEGHSDADVLLHALTDAILGACGKGDIGSFFPNNDPRWKDAASSIFLSHAMDEARSSGYAVENVDITVLAEAPKILPHIPVMKKNICTVLNIDPSACGIKATTAEGLGFIGRREGIYASAVVLLVER